MAAGGKGFFATGFFHLGYWHLDFWAEAGAAPVSGGEMLIYHHHYAHG